MSEFAAVTLFANIAEIVIAAAVVTVALRRLKQPNLFTYIVAGILIGPLVLGAHSIIFGGNLFPLGIPEITPEISLLSVLGTAFLLFSIGIETSIKRLLNAGRTLIVGTILQIALIIGVTFLLTVPFNLLSIEAALFVGVIVAFSSTLVIVKILSDKNELNSLSGRLMVSILLLQDFIVVFFYPVLASISSISNPWFFGIIILKSLFLFLVGFLLNRYVFPRLFEVAAEEQELFFLVSIATAFVFIGIGFVLGNTYPSVSGGQYNLIMVQIAAFVGGLSLSSLPYNSEIFSKIRALRDFFVTIFFVSLGAQLTFNFTALPWILMVIIVSLIFVVKPFVLFLVALFGGYGTRMGVKVGMSLGQVSEFGFELAGIGAATVTALGQPVLSPELFSFLILVIAISMIVTPYLTGSSSRLARWFYLRAENLPSGLHRKYFSRKLDELERVPSKNVLNNHIIIVGGGTVGRGLAKELVRSHQVVIVDRDPEVVRQGIRDGLPYVYGTSESSSLWEKLDLKQARLLVITILDHAEALRMVSVVKAIAPRLTIFATAHYFSDTSNLYRHKVDFVAMPSIMGGNVFLENIASFLEKGKLSSLSNFRSEYMAYLNDQVEEEKRYKRR